MNKLIGVIGIGSPNGADSIAERVIQLLKKHPKNKFEHNIQFAYYDRPGIYLLELIKNFNVLHLIDAVVSNKPIGTIHRYEDINALEVKNFLLSSHGVGVAEVLSLGKILNCLPEKIIIHGIEIDGLEMPISNEIINAAERLSKKIILELTVINC